MYQRIGMTMFELPHIHPTWKITILGSTGPILVTGSATRSQRWVTMDMSDDTFEIIDILRPKQ